MLFISPQSCHLIGSTFSNLVQLSLGLIGFLTLLVKWKLEKGHNRRSNLYFMLDVSKQAIGSLIAHGANMIIAMWLSHLVTDTNECAWYFVSYSCDTILGVTLAYLFIKLVIYYANKYEYTRLAENGNYRIVGYTSTYDITITWLIQLLSWIWIIAFSRLFVALLLWIGKDFFSIFAQWIASIFEGNPNLLLLFVMIICPGIMNICQAWMIDNILKRKKDDRPILDHDLLINDEDEGNTNITEEEL
jgi:hypothetical protein